ncbi:protein PFC0760c-like isoform X2 [Danaus plexippus]|uniref:protein PFC0760c-like isoform X2 n=1 Tax=Danaus plexippus TaxID=13037 RepID=UPI002AB0E2CA|nr:protein PFC0760c-like isoform X2 [Danaus plexippus]
MGKSDKKNKSEKIKALRKRYDAFLEEDKKRKERNDYILERLEKMRSCITLVQVRCKGYSKDSCDYQGGVIKRAIDGPRHMYAKSDNQKRDELNILKEISQKYILIPKGATNDPKNNYDRVIPGDPGLVQSPSNDMDWKSKYSILDELKRQEKGENSKATADKRHGDNDLHDDVKNKNYILEDSNLKTNYQNENSDNRDLLPNKLDDGHDLNTVNRPNREERNNYRNKEKEPKNSEDLNIEATSALSAEQDEIPLDKNNDQEAKSKLNDLLPQNYQVEVKQDQIYYDSNLKEEKDLKNNLYEKLTEEQQPTAVCKDKYLPEEKNVTEVEKMSPENIAQTASDLPSVVSNETVNVVAKEDIPLSYSNSPEQIKNDNLVIAKTAEVKPTLREEPSTDIKEHEYQQQESNMKTEENIEQNASLDVNNEFETEQREMFYEETAGVYKQGDTTVYPEENENYANQEYSNYYEDIQKEQIYPIDINEHEETIERYDPNYEEQYANNYDGTDETEYQTQVYGVDDTYNQQVAYDQPGDNYQEQQIQNYEAGDKEAGKGDQAVYYDNAQTKEPYDNKLGDQPEAAYTEGYETQDYALVQEAPSIDAIGEQLDLEDKYIQNPNKSVENQDHKNDIEQTSEVKHPDANVI